MKWYHYEIIYLDRDRFYRTKAGRVVASSLRSATQRSVQDARLNARGWRETTNAEFTIKMTIGGAASGGEEGRP